MLYGIMALEELGCDFRAMLAQTTAAKADVQDALCQVLVLAAACPLPLLTNIVEPTHWWTYFPMSSILHRDKTAS